VIKVQAMKGAAVVDTLSLAWPVPSDRRKSGKRVVARIEQLDVACCW
jgi:hypothetical protein